MEEEIKDVGLPEQFGRKKSSRGKSRRIFGTKKGAERDAQPDAQTNELRIQQSVSSAVGPEPAETGSPRFPTTQEYQILGHTKSVTALCFNSAGSRLYTGGSDPSIKYWSFPSLNILDTHPDVSIEIQSSYDIASVDVTPDGQYILVASGTPQATIFDSKGLRKGETKRGDMYLYEVRQTIGHIAALVGAFFCPTTASLFATASKDGTVRFWDFLNLEKHKTLFKLGQHGGVRNPANSIRWTRDGSGVWVSGSDPCVRFFTETEAGSVFELMDVAKAIDIQDNMLATRFETSLALWDWRQTDRPVWTYETRSDTGCVRFSPDYSMLVVPESVHRGSIHGGSLVFIDVETGQCTEEVMFPASVGARSCEWSGVTNQIAVGCTDGVTRVLYDPRISKAGVMLSLEKGITVKVETDEAVIGSLTPRLIDPETERVIRGFWFPYSDPEKRDRRAAAEPKAPLWGEGHHGRIAVHPLQAKLKELGQVDVPDDGDVVEALRARNREAKLKYFTSVKKNEEDDE
jgi:WD40 repeat protein